MKKLLITLLSVILLSGCGIFDRGNYEKNRNGFVISGNIIVNYHTNSIGEIDIFMIDQIMTFFEALDYTEFDTNRLSNHETTPSLVSVDELSTCGIEKDEAIPRFLRVDKKTYFYNIRDNGYCTFDEYNFHEDGYSTQAITDPELEEPIEQLNLLRFKNTDFTINTFDEIIYIENIDYDSTDEVWVKTIVTALPMSLSQAGDNYGNVSDIIEEMRIIENYVLTNQSVNLLLLKEDYQDEDVNNIWQQATIDSLGRDHELVKKVRLKNTGDILDIINDALSRLGMF